MMRRLSARGVLVALIAVSVLLAGCFGGRRGRAPSAGEAQPLPADSAVDRDSARPPVTRADSLRVDSAQAAARRDSITADSSRRDSLVRDTTDTITRAADSAKKVTVPVKRKPAPKECVLDFNESPPESRLISNLLNDGSRTTFIGGGMVARCQGDPQTIRADSAEQYESIEMLVLIGNVVFEEPGKMRVTAPNATYFAGEERLVATGGVVATDLPTGSTITGPTIEYFRAGSRRPFSRLYAPQRPTMRLVEKDSSGTEQSPISITANQFEQSGDSTLVGWGDVVIDREQITGRSDSASFDNITEKARLIRNAFILSRDTTRPFRLVGDSIDMFSKDRKLERVVALHRAQATSNDVTMRAERVEMRLDSQVVDRAWAYGPGRAYAETSTQSLEADSIEILMPAQLVQALHAIGRALAFGTPDSLRIRNAEQDVLSGDTIVALFDTVTTAPDTAPKSSITRVIATRTASARYRIPSSRGAYCPPGINYVRGKRIVVDFESGSVRTVAVDSQASGVFLEPSADSMGDTTSMRCASPSDSTKRDTITPGSVTPPVTPPPPGTVPPGAVPPPWAAPRDSRLLSLRRVSTALPFDVPRRRGDPWWRVPADPQLAS